MTKDQDITTGIDCRDQGIQLWDQMRRNFVAKPFLFGLSLIYGSCVSLRQKGYALGVMPIKHLPCPVFSVGNLTVGGTGKTPVVRMIAEDLMSMGRHPAILTRGYKRQDRRGLTVVSDLEKILTVPEEVGDEPYMMAQWLPGTPVIVGKNRYQSGIFALNHFGTDCFILDDGFQHMGLFRDLDILVINASDPFDHGKLLPYGHLRESLSAINRASLILLNKSDSDQDLNPIMDIIRQYNKEAPVFETTYTPEYLVPAADQRSHIPLSSLKDRPILVFSGIADPSSLLNELTKTGAKIAQSIVFSDHHWFSERDVQLIQKMAERFRAEYIVTTEKDGVRLPTDNQKAIYLLKMKMALKKSADIFKDILWDKIPSL